MKRFARALAVTFGIVVLSSFVLLVPQKKASAQDAGPTVTIGSPIPLPVKQSGNWNVGLAPNATVGISGTPNVSVGNFPSALTGASVPVSLRQSSNFKALASFFGGNYNEILPDGTLVVGPFTIQQGQEFVVTDVNWIAECDIPLGCPLSPGDASAIVIGAAYSSVSAYERRGPRLVAGHSDHLTSGLVVTQLAVPQMMFAGASGESITKVVLQGYLVP